MLISFCIIILQQEISVIFIYHGLIDTKMGVKVRNQQDSANAWSGMITERKEIEVLIN
jgi:hypothetical protein